MRGKVAVTTSSFAEHDPAPVNLLEQSGFSVVRNALGRKLDREETLKLCSGCIGIVAGTEMYDQNILQRLGGLKVVSRCGVGMENVDGACANKLGIKVCNTPDAVTLAVAELTIGLILALLRKITFMDRNIRKGLWQKKMGSLLFGKQVGIIGFGRIGRKVAWLLQTMSANVFYNDPMVTKKESGEFTQVELGELLKKSDIISLHLSYSQKNHKLLGQKELSLMKPGAFLINCSRGGIVDEDALYLALKEGRLTGCAIDVFEQEPYNGPLKELDNVILTPHIGSYAKEARVKMELEAVKNLIKGLRSTVD